MSIAGNLRTMAFSDLVQWLCSSLKTGTLVIEGPKYTKRVYLKQGKLSAIESDNPREMMGYYLVGWGFLTEEQLQLSIHMQTQTQMALGEMVVRLGYVTTDVVDNIVQLKTEDGVYDLLTWEEGEFRFLEGDLPERYFREIQLPIQHLLLEGARQRDERQRIRKLVPDAQHVPVLLPEAVLQPQDALDLDIVSAIDGNRNIEQIALACRVPQFQVLNFVYNGVKERGVRLDPPADTAPAIPGQSHAPWHESLLEIKDRIKRDRLFDALKLVNTMRERYADHAQVVEEAANLEGEIESKLDQGQLEPDAALEPAADLGELMKLECDPAEGFVLSRITGSYTVDEVLSQLPGPPLQNRVILQNLLRRGLIKVRKVKAVKPYQPSETG